MRIPRLSGPEAWKYLSILFSLSTCPTNAYNVTGAPSPDLDFSQLGRVALTGNFDSIALFNYEGQTENVFTNNGSQALFTQLGNGAFETLAMADASIMTMCNFVRKDGTFAGVIVGGNFTSLGGVPAQGIALFKTSDNSVVPLTGLNGSVNALWCDQATDSVYVGGDFRGSNSTNAIAWIGVTGWTNMPFKGFNAPVNTITQTPSGNIIFGGSFTGLGNMSTPSAEDAQIINLSSANISATPSTTSAGSSNPSSIVCTTNSSDGSNSTWLLPDNTAGSWSASLGFGFEPTKLRLYNTHQDGRGTKTWRFSNNPNSILRFTFLDPDNNNQNATCDQTCPLSSNPSVQFQDFFFVNTVGMNGFSIDISDWYGSGGGLDGIQLFENDIFSYAVSSFNEPACATTSARSGSTSTGPWEITPSGNSVAEYLTANLQGPGVNSGSASVTFLPDIKQAGNYTVTVYTPGCKQDNSCGQRGQANLTGIFTSTQAANPVQSSIFQTNDFDKYDQIYTGTVETGAGSFRPSLILSPLDNQNSSITLTALRVRFELLDPSSIGLNGLYEYDPANITANTDFKSSKIDSIGISLDDGADVNSLVTIGNSTFVGGKFSSQNASNILAIGPDDNLIVLPGGGLNDEVTTMTGFGNLLFIGGNFTNTNTTNTPGLSRVAQMDTGQNTWSTLGNGVNGPVTNIVQLSLNVTPGVPEECITVNGPFTQVLATDSNPAFEADGLATWVPGRNAWLANLNVDQQALRGQLTFALNMTDNTPLVSGTISAQGWALTDSAELSAVNGVPILNSTGLHLQPDSSSSALRKRSDDASTANTANATGVLTGIIDSTGGRNVTIFGGHFTAKGSNGQNITNLAIINDASGEVTGIPSGIDPNSTFLSLATNGDLLYAGGVVTGNASGTPINGLVVWDMATSAFNSTLPPALAGNTVAVNAIAMRPNTADLYVAGLFDGAAGKGSVFSCPSVCIFTGGSWSRPGQNFGGGNVTAMLWQGTSNNLLVVGSNLTVGNTQTSVAMYSATSQDWSIPSGAPNSVPGPVTALSPASGDGTSYWLAGQQSNGLPFMTLFNNNQFQSAPALGHNSFIRGLSVLSLTQQHAANNFMNPQLALLVTGELNMPVFGNVSGVLFDGNNYTALLLSNEGNNPGSVGQVITEQLQSFNIGPTPLAVGFVVLISLAIALGVIFLLIALGLLIERRRRKAEGYRPAPQNYFEKTANMGRIPPERLFGDLSAPAGPRV